MFLKYGKPYQKKWRPLVLWGDKSNLPPIKLNSLQLRQKLTVALLGTSHGTRCYRQKLTMLIVWFDSVTRIWICRGWYALILRLMITRQISIHCLTVRQCLGERRIVTNNTGVSTRFVIQTEWMSPYQRYVSFLCYKGLLVRRQSPKRATSMFHKLYEPDYVGPIKAPEYLPLELQIIFMRAMLKNWFQVDEKPIEEKYFAYRDDVRF